MSQSDDVPCLPGVVGGLRNANQSAYIVVRKRVFAHQLFRQKLNAIDMAAAKACPGYASAPAQTDYNLAVQGRDTARKLLGKSTDDDPFMLGNPDDFKVFEPTARDLQLEEEGRKMAEMLKPYMSRPAGLGRMA
jgi:hypothetical protein